MSVSTRRMPTQPALQDATADIRVFLIDSVSLVERPGDGHLYGRSTIAGYWFLNTNAVLVITGDAAGAVHGVAKLKDVIAHELGHVMVGEGHPDEGTGAAPLPGTNHAIRLMCGGLRRNPDAKALVKAEWDRADNWLDTNLVSPQ